VEILLSDVLDYGYEGFYFGNNQIMHGNATLLGRGQAAVINTSETGSLTL